ncbi:MAG: helix-turn-helix transcriptional regulator, partial [Betaproteobacteria bacterium]|nr:helix-turn-helix transcriptional regulator [Betaproteobacteria bacterium]
MSPHLLRRNTQNAKSRFTIPAVPTRHAMPLAHSIVDALKRCLRARGMTYAKLARELRLSEASVKRLFSRRTFTLSRLEEILRVLELDLAELARMTRSANSPEAQLSLEQETLLASDE